MPESLKLHKYGIITLFFLSLFSLGCSYNNSHYEEMKVIEDAIRKDNNNKEHWNLLTKASNSSNYWDRFYAFSSLSSLRKSNIKDPNNKIDDLIIKGFFSADYEIKKICLYSISAIGEPLLSRAMPQFIEILSRHEENDLTWSVIEALSLIEDKKQAHQLIKQLIKACHNPPYEGAQDEAPQIRHFALESAKELIIKHRIYDKNIIDSFKDLLKIENDYFRRMVAEAITKIEEGKSKSD